MDEVGVSGVEEGELAGCAVLDIVGVGDPISPIAAGSHAKSKMMITTSAKRVPCPKHPALRAAFMGSE